ncbi:MAG: hypothetical protein OJF49_000224 [Ktedonobacterales bacterium]|jgi:glycine/D-amino acid oxidase-like deaminating enzyme|nr:MAG: hypothetical protein OJF49_000224 [Ktedonobacterales bacterium]
MGSVSFWQAETEIFDAPQSAPQLEGAHEAEIAIIGAGITGTAAALWLARAGMRVAVIEGRRIAAGASGRNGGFLLSGTSESYATAIARYGHECAYRIWDFTVRNQTIAAQLVGELAEAGWECGYQRVGSLRIASAEAELDELAASITLLHEDGWQAETTTRDQLPQRLRHAYLGGIYYPLDAEIQPARFVAGIARLATQEGAAFYEKSPVTRLSVDTNGILIETEHGSLRARQVLLAANAWLPDLAQQVGADWLARAITPTRGQMLATEPVAERIFTCPCYANEGYEYFRQLADGRLVIGGWRNTSFDSENTADETPGNPVQDNVERFLRDILRLPDLRVEQRWAGIMAFSADGLPFVGALPGVPDVYVSGGYTGHGNAYALLAARLISDLAKGAPNADADLFDPARIVPT